MAKQQNLAPIDFNEWKRQQKLGKSEIKWNDRLLTIGDLCEKLRKGRTSVWRLRKQPGFPVPVYLGETPQWLESEIDAWTQAHKDKL
jgi:predicted DNA-binding transcriptional regulator AlpA